MVVTALAHAGPISLHYPRDPGEDLPDRDGSALAGRTFDQGSRGRSAYLPQATPHTARAAGSLTGTDGPGPIAP